MAGQTETIAPPDQLVGLYTMFYRFNSNNLQSKNFRFSGSLQKARERAEEHCKIMGYRLHFVQPLISDLKKEEDFQLGKVKVEPNIEQIKVTKD